MHHDKMLSVSDNIGMAGNRHFYLREWRKHKSLTQEALGNLVGMTKGQVSEYERGVEKGGRRYNETTIELFSKALNIEPWELLGRDPNKESSSLTSIFDHIPEESREQAVKTLESFVKKRG